MTPAQAWGDRPSPDATTAGLSRPWSRVVILVLVLLGVQVVVAAAMLTTERPAPYGWQMYSAVPYNPPAWAVTDGTRRSIDAEALLVHGRAEIDRVELLRSEGCDRTGADAIVIELADGRLDEVVCR